MFGIPLDLTKLHYIVNLKKFGRIWYLVDLNRDESSIGVLLVWTQKRDKAVGMNKQTCEQLIDGLLKAKKHYNINMEMK